MRGNSERVQLALPIQHMQQASANDAALHDAFHANDGSLPAFKPVRRDRLISALLQDRHVLRLIVGPHGFGKTALAREYAERIFETTRVKWIKASDPVFLAALDGGIAHAASEFSDGELVILDDVPYLDENRAETLSHFIDTVLYKGAEVIATTLPSRDCLRSRQPGCILISACELLVTEEESRSSVSTGAGADAHAHATYRWRHACETMFGRVPNVFWGSQSSDVRLCLVQLFDEQLPRQLVQTMIAMMLLGSGAFRELESMGIAVTAEDAEALEKSYPLFGMDRLRESFNVGACPLESIRASVEPDMLVPLKKTNEDSLPEQAISVLFKRRDFERAHEILDLYCSDSRCGQWVHAHGWDLLDLGEFQLVDELLERCPYDDASERREFEAIRMWTCGFLGNWREAGHIAQILLKEGDLTSREEADTVSMLAYLALLAFDEGGALLYGKRVFKDEFGPGVGWNACAQLVDVMDECELSRALSQDDKERFARLAAERVPAEAERAGRIAGMLSQFASKGFDSLWFRVCLHLASFVDDAQLRSVIQDIACDNVVVMRRRGLLTLSEALLVRDLWLFGYFGPSGSARGKRDAQLLDEAGRLLRAMCRSIGYATVNIPWDVAPYILHSPTDQGTTEATEDAAIPPLRITVFGGFEIALGDQLIDEGTLRRKARLFIEVLALHLGRDVSRDELLKTLWPRSERKRALDNFYTVWSNVRNALGGGEPYVIYEGGFFHLNNRVVISDVGEFEQLSRNILLERVDNAALMDTYVRIESLYRGGLLPGERMVPYIDSRREKYREMYIDNMITASERALGMNDVRLALWFARKAYEFERKREDVYLALIRAQAAAGQRCTAIRTYFECTTYLRDELGIDPSAEMQTIYGRLITEDPTLRELTQETFKLAP